MLADYGSDIYAVADGVVKPISQSGWGNGNCALVIEHKTHDGTVFTAIYGHLQCGSLPAVKSDVYAGKPVGKVGHWDYGDHLHFGIHPDSYSKIASSHWGRQFINGNWTDPCIGNCLNTFTSPVDFIQTHYAYNPSTERQTMCQGNICWEPKTASCETATSRYRIVNPPYAQSEGAGVCSELQANLIYITSAPNPQERIPEDHGWRKWWRAIVNFFGEIAKAEEIRSFTTINTINVYAGTVVHGNATLAIHGAGAGYMTEVADATTPNLPDFITKKTWLVTPWGTETYKFGMNESFDTKAQSENIGDSSCLSSEIQTITGHFYLSKGYKEDSHSGDGAWRRVDSTTTQCNNLQPGDTHTETKNTVIREWITTPGIYNIVYCIDHPLDDHNNGGDHQEKHESNNCSTEAVFEVTADAIVNMDPRFVDFVTNGLQFRGTPPVYAGDQARLGVTITNQGNITSPADIRSSYSVECSGTGRVYLTDDGTQASTLTAGASAWEETIAPITLPNVAGSCTAFFCADYQGAVSESDEMNNCTSLSFTLQPRPKPKLVITKFQDEVGCCTTNTGSRIKPDIWVRNDGPVSPVSDVQVIYQISSPVATGGTFQTIGYGVIHPSELPSGGTDEDYMDNSWSIPKNSTWKNRWHTVRGCLKVDGIGTPIGGGAGEICATYGRYSKK